MVDDSELEQRLRRLNEDETVKKVMSKQKSLDMQKEIEVRLAKLQERDENFYSSEPPVKILSIQTITQNKSQTDVEMADDLIQQLMDEVHLDDQQKFCQQVADEDLEKRLQNLAKAQQELNIENPARNKMKKTGHLIHKLLSLNQSYQDDDEQEENNNRQHYRQQNDLASHSQQDTNEIDWCTTCNEDGVVRCIDCDNDIYCRECFRELHRSSDMRGHRTQPYKT